MLVRLKIRGIPWTEEPGRLQAIGLQRVRQDWNDLARIHAPVFKRVFVNTQQSRGMDRTGGQTVQQHSILINNHTSAWRKFVCIYYMHQSNFDLETSVPSWWEVQPRDVRVFLPIWRKGTKMSRASGEWCNPSGSFTGDFSIHRQMEQPGFLRASERQGALRPFRKSWQTNKVWDWS